MKYSAMITTVMACCMMIACIHRTGKDKKEMKAQTYEQGSYGYDLNFLKEKDKGLIVLKQDSSQVIVSPKYQGKVFTSSAAGPGGKSFGWVNYEAFEGEEDPHMNAYGGENRFWLGPEGSKFSLFFNPGSPMVFDHWKTPPAIDTEPWEVVNSNSSGVRMKKEMSIVNYAGTNLRIKAEREVRILGKEKMEKLLNVNLGNIQSVGFTTDNAIINTGDRAWTKETGAPCIWILDMFTPSDETVIIIPYREDTAVAEHSRSRGKVATTDYFGEIPKDRISYANGHLFFRADGKSRGKLGIPPNRAKTIAGSYDQLNKVLTITLFEVDNNAVYLNQEWTPDKDPLSGDAINAYNDGPLEDGSQMGPFYEIESVSPAAFLQPQEKLTHRHSVFHLTGEEARLNKIARAVLGVELETVKNTFNTKKTK
ncbi:DUF6786 family protein [Sinomicrobium weinanense]|uniref:Lipoprotein n=1 Tax=Sinomicrobium weinanense TaxID=2842200 RepID=A0A926Q1L1_9FLAO|nr:DUF6786 family protein [Sinomicrobium weinanense]MBC9795728.1 hypothetical protein [Sinomicrobium weinanense]MBU3125291.1 hypothetical protein [Sinomicrobium weinanense]